MKGRPRLPHAVAEATGAIIKNPANFRDRKPPKVPPLGKPPATLTPEQADIWREIAADVPWLCRSDRLVLESASRLVSRMRTDPDFPMSGYSELRGLLARMGATPTDRTRITAQDDDEPDPADKFFQ